MSEREQNDTVSRLIQDSIAGGISRREILRRGAILGVAAPMVAAMVKVSETSVAAQLVRSLMRSSWVVPGSAV